jgi:hypothetical protein
VRLLEAFAAREIADDIPTAETAWAERLSISASYTTLVAGQILFHRRSARCRAS